MSLLFGPRLILEKVAAPAQTSGLILPAKAFVECTVKLVGNGVSSAYSVLAPGDRVVVPANCGTQVPLGRTTETMVNETDIILKLDSKSAAGPSRAR